MAKKPTYTQDQKDEIFERICMRVAGGRAIRNVIKDKDVYSIELFYKALVDKDKAKRYARACEERAEEIFEDILTIADYSGKDQIDIGDGVMAVNHEAMQRDRLRVDARKWILSKMNPKKYGDKTDITSGGEKLDSKTVVEFKNFDGIKRKEKK